MTWSATDGGTYLRCGLTLPFFGGIPLPNFGAVKLRITLCHGEKTKDEIYRSRKQKLF